MTENTEKIGTGGFNVQPDSLSFTVDLNGSTKEIVRINPFGTIFVRGERHYCECAVCVALKEWAKGMRGG